MRAYILRVLGVSLFTTLCHLFLPDGKVRRFAAPVMGLAVTAAILVPAVGFLQKDMTADSLLPRVETVLESDTYVRAVEEEYKKRIAAEIMARGDVQATVFLGDGYKVERILLEGDVTSAVMQYITTELEVGRSRVEIR